MQRAGRRRLPAALLIVCVAAVTSLVGVAAVPRPVVADGGLRIESTTTFVVDSTTGIVKVNAEFTLTNTLSDKRRGNSVERPFFTGFSLPVVASNFGVEAEQNGVPLRVSVSTEPGARVYSRADVELSKRLWAKKTTTVNVRYLIVGAPPRDDNLVRASAAFVAFPAFGVGDPGHTTMRVIVPFGWVIDDVFDGGNPPQRTEAFGGVVYTFDNIPNPDEVTLWVMASNPSQLARTLFSDIDRNIYEIYRWPADKEWARFVTTQLAAVPAYTDLVGQPWPVSDRLKVLETISPEIEGYAGSFDRYTNTIEIGERLDQTTVLHEIGHAWFGDEWYLQRWLYEGFAETYAVEMVRRLGGTPEPPDPLSHATAGALALNEWSSSTTAITDEDAERFGYNASYAVTSQIVDEIGMDAMREVIAAHQQRRELFPDPTATGTPPVTPADPESPVIADWRRMLDLLEIVGGSTTAHDLFREWVLTTTEQAELDRRDRVRARYADLVADAGDLGVPERLRPLVELWRWPAAEQMLDTAEPVVEALHDLQRAMPTSPETDQLAARYRDAALTDIGQLLIDVQQATQGPGTSHTTTVRPAALR